MSCDPTKTLSVEHQSPEVLQPRGNSPRTHSISEIRRIADSIKTFGFVNPTLIDASNQIVTGHGRMLGAKQLSVEGIDLGRRNKNYKSRPSALAPVRKS